MEKNANAFPPAQPYHGRNSYTSWEHQYYKERTVQSDPKVR